MSQFKPTGSLTRRNFNRIILGSTIVTQLISSQTETVEQPNVDLLFSYTSGSLIKENSMNRNTWDFEMSTESITTPIISDGTVFTTDTNGYVYAVDVTDGSEKWRQELAAPIESTPDIQNNSLICATRRGDVYALDIESGDIQWNNTLNGRINADIVTDESRAYIPTTDSQSSLYAISIDTGDVEWTFQYSSDYMPSIDPNQDAIYISAQNNRIYALSAKNGEVQWSRSIRSTLNTTPQVANGIVYVGDSQGKVHHISAENGERIWRPYDAGISVRYIHITSDAVYTIVDNQTLYKFNIFESVRNGDTVEDEVWSYTLNSQITGPPQLLNSNMYVSSRDGGVHYVNTETGEGSQLISVGGLDISSPVTVNEAPEEIDSTDSESDNDSDNTNTDSESESDSNENTTTDDSNPESANTGTSSNSGGGGFISNIINSIRSALGL